MSSVFQFILAFMNAVPKLRELWDQAVAAYIKKEIAKMHSRDREAIRKAIYEHDQRELEKQVFNTEPGLPSGLPGTSIVSELPNVKLQGTKESGN